MTKVTFLPHELICPHGLTVEAEPGQTVLEVALSNDIAIEHACDMSCACTTCHVVIVQGYNSLPDISEQEEDLLDRAWGLTVNSRLGCQALVQQQDLVIDIPKYTINQVAERKK